MANSLVTAGAELRTGRPPEEAKPMADAPKDTRVVMYRATTAAGGVEAREFPAPDAVPKDEGWVDHPDKAAEKHVKPAGKKKPAPAPAEDDDAE